MKRLGISDSLGALMSMCPTTEEHSSHGDHYVYNREFQTMVEGGLDEEISMEEFGGEIGEKKRRLSVKQVKALEKSFQVEKKLEPENKVKLAQQLGLQPRQVAIWFQNRRARSKTKNLERDYGLLKSNFDALNHNCDALRHHNEALLKQIQELKSKLQEVSNLSVKEETKVSESDNKSMDQIIPPIGSLIGSDRTLLFPDLKDGSSDSDSSTILNDDNSPKSGILETYPLNCSSSSSNSSINRFEFPEANQTQFVKLEEHNFFGADESCNFFSDEEAPTLQWYCSEQWD